VAALERDPADLPYVVLYAADGAGEAAHLCGAVGLSAGSGRAPSTIEPSAADAPWPFGEVGRTLEPVAAQEAMICPLTGPGGGLCGYLVAGLSPRLPMDEAYRAFLTA